MGGSSRCEDMLRSAVAAMSRVCTRRGGSYPSLSRAQSLTHTLSSKCYAALLLPLPGCRTLSRGLATGPGNDKPTSDERKSASQNEPLPKMSQTRKTVVAKGTDRLSKKRPQYDPVRLDADSVLWLTQGWCRKSSKPWK